MTTPTTIGIVTIIDVSQVEVNQKKKKLILQQLYNFPFLKR